ncbi:MAG: acetate kinase [Spirochaetales bacterium]
MVILTLNCGSSSVKYQVYNWEEKMVMAKGLVERVGTPDSVLEHSTHHNETLTINREIPDHETAIQMILETVADSRVGVVKKIEDVKAVGHRVLHGGQKFGKSVLVTPESLQTFRELVDLGPLHLPANISGIEAAQRVLPNVPQIAVLDTAWHQTMPASSYIYAVPYNWYTYYGVRRYGFHGTSFLYTAKRASVLLGKDPMETNLIIAHVGNGASMSAVKDGCAFDTSMGLTPLEGLIMGTRSGDIDPAIINYICRRTGMTSQQVENDLNKKSGLLGVTGRFSDRRDVNQAADNGDAQSQLARSMEGYRLKKYIGGYMAGLGRVDAIVFTAGVGEMSPATREEALKGLDNLGIILDPDKNKLSRTRNAETCISADHSPIKIFVIPTDEELVITEDAYAISAGTYDIHTNFKYSFEAKDYVNKERVKGLEKELKKNPALQDILA